MSTYIYMYVRLANFRNSNPIEPPARLLARVLITTLDTVNSLHHLAELGPQSVLILPADIGSQNEEQGGRHPD